MAQNDSSEIITSIAIDNPIENTLVDNDDWSNETLEQARFIVQRILVPCIVTIGIAGNLLTVIVLTRRRMRCSTNIYLTALAIADIIFLFFVFILSLQQYPHFKYGHGLYWSSIGLSNWFHDATLYSSVYLTVSFTLERYISVCHPLRGQVLCTESRAKKVITAVFILCFLCTITTRFEFELTVDHKRFDYSVGQPCDRNDSAHCILVPWYQIEQSNLSLAAKYHNLFHYPSAFFGVLLPFVLLSILNGFLIWTVRKSQKMRHNMTNTRQADKSQENKVTITLIAVVILFLVCQTPNTLQMLNIMHQSHHKNKQRVMNNVYNLLLAVNAASNFILYCVLSDKYRKTVKALFCGTGPIRRNTLSSSRFTSGRTTSSFYSRSHNSGLFNMKSFKKKQGPRFSITKEDYANLQAVTAKRGRFSISTSPNSRNDSIVEVDQNEVIPMKESTMKASDPERSRIRFSFTPTINVKSKPKTNPESILKIDEENLSKTEVTEIALCPVQAATGAEPTETNAQPNGSAQAQPVNTSFLRPSPSETSLTRSRSLIIPKLPKHSPDCKDNPYKF